MGGGNVWYYVEDYGVYDSENVGEVDKWLVEIVGNFGLLMMVGYVWVYG